MEALGVSPIIITSSNGKDLSRVVAVVGRHKVVHHRFSNQSLEPFLHLHMVPQPPLPPASVLLPTKAVDLVQQLDPLPTPCMMRQMINVNNDFLKIGESILYLLSLLSPFSSLIKSLCFKFSVIVLNDISHF